MSNYYPTTPTTDGNETRGSSAAENGASPGAESRMPTETGLWSPVGMSLGSCRPTALEWLWPGRIPRGKLTLLIGDPGLGKSLVTLDLAARVTRGLALPQLAEVPSVADVPPQEGDASSGSAAAELPIQSPGSVILLSAEDDVRDTICPRLAAAGADLDRVHALEAVAYRGLCAGGKGHERFSISAHLEALQAMICSLDDCRLVVVDPLPAYMSGTDTHNNADVRGLLAPLAELAAQTGVAVLGVNHLVKASYGPAIYRSMGSLAIAAAARSVLVAVRDPDDPSRIVLASAKNNLGATAGGIAYRIETLADIGLPVVRWSDTPVHTTADDLLAAAAKSASTGSATEEAARWLDDLLRDGPQSVLEIFELARKFGFSISVLRRAKGRLGIRSVRHGFGLRGSYTWQLPKGPSPIASDPAATAREPASRRDECPSAIEALMDTHGGPPETLAIYE